MVVFSNTPLPPHNHIMSFAAIVLELVPKRALLCLCFGIMSSERDGKAGGLLGGFLNLCCGAALAVNSPVSTGGCGAAEHSGSKESWRRQQRACTSFSGSLLQLNASAKKAFSVSLQRWDRGLRQGRVKAAPRPSDAFFSCSGVPVLERAHAARGTSKRCSLSCS